MRLWYRDRSRADFWMRMIPRLILTVLSAVVAQAQTPGFNQTVLPLLKNNCAACHNNRSNSGGLSIEDFYSEQSMVSNRDAWERILKRLRNGTMPPGKDKPAGIAEVISFVEGALETREKKPSGSR